MNICSVISEIKNMWQGRYNPLLYDNFVHCSNNEHGLLSLSARRRRSGKYLCNVIFTFSVYLPTTPLGVTIQKTAIKIQLMGNLKYYQSEIQILCVKNIFNFVSKIFSRRCVQAYTQAGFMLSCSLPIRKINIT